MYGSSQFEARQNRNIRQPNQWGVWNLVTDQWHSLFANEYFWTEKEAQDYAMKITSESSPGAKELLKEELAQTQMDLDRALLELDYFRCFLNFPGVHELKVKFDIKNRAIPEVD